MTHEEMERSIEFILQQQAKMSSDMVQLKMFGFELAKAQIRVENNMAELAEAHKRLADAQKTTDDRINALIAMFERYLGGNGKGPKSE